MVKETEQEKQVAAARSTQEQQQNEVQQNQQNEQQDKEARKQAVMDQLRQDRENGPKRER